MTATTRGVVLLLATAVISLGASPAAAQAPEDEEVRLAEISYEIGDFDPERGDWPIVGVEVRGQLDTEQAVTVELWGADQRLWTGTVSVTPPVTRLEVVPFVAVSDLVEVGIWQQLAPVEVLPLDPTVLPTVVLPSGPPAAVDPDEDEVVEPVDPPVVEGSQVERAESEVLWSASGGGGAGQLALSMILTTIVVAILFRSPLPSASTQRWTK